MRDVEALRELLIEHHQFPEDRVVVLTDEAATRARILDQMARLTDSLKVDPNDRVIVFFSGHGQTVRMPRGGEMGFVLPHDAAVDLKDRENPAPYYGTAVGMDELWRLSDLIPAKHVLFLVDACYSGLAIRRRKGLGPEMPFYLTVAVNSPVRQVITAGKKGEVSIESSKWGHGAFTFKLLEGSGRDAGADANDDRVIAGLELAAFLRAEVPRIADQNPKFGYFEGEGEFLFFSRPLTLDMVSEPPPPPSTSNRYTEAFAAIKGEKYQEAYESLIPGTVSTADEAAESVFLRTALSAAFCAGNITELRILKEGVEKENNERLAALYLKVIRRASDWAKRLRRDAEHALTTARKGPAELDLELPDLVSDLALEGARISGDAREGRLPSEGDEDQLERFLVGMHLRQMIVASFDPEASWVDMGNSKWQGSVQWVPSPLLPAVRALLARDGQSQHHGA